LEKLSLLGIPIAVMAAFQLAFRFAPPRKVWPVAVVLLVIITAIAIWFDQHAFTSTSPVAFAPMLIVPGIVSGAIAQLGHGRWPWPVTTLVGSLATVLAVIPMWMFSCVLAEAFSLGPGCRF
jgi:peptidoglycan/LPS O-acetylase OafA/YrhL